MLNFQFISINLETVLFILQIYGMVAFLGTQSFSSLKKRLIFPDLRSAHTSALPTFNLTRVAILVPNFLAISSQLVSFSFLCSATLYSTLLPVLIPPLCSLSPSKNKLYTVFFVTKSTTFTAPFTHPPQLSLSTSSLSNMAI